MKRFYAWLIEILRASPLVFALLVGLILICLFSSCRIPIPGVDKRSQGSIDSQKAYERSKTNALNSQPQNETIGAKNGTNVAFSATNSALNETKAPFRETYNLLPAVSTRAVVSHAAPAPVTNLVVTWEVNLSNTPSCGWTGSGGWKTNAQGVGYFSTNGLQWTTQYLSAAYLLTWIDEKNGGSWYQRTPANAPLATNAAVIANTNKSGLLRSVLGWK